MPSSAQAAPAPFPNVHLDFESGTFEGWSVKRLAGPHAATIQSEVVRIGTRACRFELRPGDYVSQGHRAELRDPFNALWEHEIWYGFSTQVSAERPPPASIGCVLAQWHDQAKLGDPSGKPPVALRLRGRELRVTGAYGKLASPDPDRRYVFATVPDFAFGIWHDFVFRMVWSRHGTSELGVWLNRAPLVDWRGPLAYENEAEGPYFKFGLYWSPPGDAPAVVYHDNYSRGHSFDEVDPSIRHGGPDAGG